MVIGGGTGTVAVLSGLKKYSDLELSIIVSMTDDGGSNAVVRDQFGLLPLSDVRKSIIALAETDNQLLRGLFTYRFAKGDGLSGHTLGNLMMVALSDICGSEVEAIKKLSELFRVKGKVIPVTLENTELVAEYDNGQCIRGEHLIDEPELDPGRILKLSLSKSVQANAQAIAAIKEADIIIAGPGDLYTSTLANIIISGISETIQQSAAKFIFVNNVMTKKGQTDGLQASDIVTEITRYAGRRPDVVVLHQGDFPPVILAKYQARGEEPVKDNLDDSLYTVVRQDVASSIEIHEDAGDTLVRSLIRHDPEKLGNLLYAFMNTEYGI